MNSDHDARGKTGTSRRAVAAPEAGHKRRAMLLALLGTALGAGLSACGGGGGGGDDGSGAASTEGRRETRSVRARATGSDYTLNIFVPPDSAGPRSSLPVIYLLDGDSWFETMVGIVQASRRWCIVVGIASMGLRQRDFVPAINTCTSGGGGHELYWQFLREQLLPYIQTEVGGDPAQQVLFGHSHGGSFVIYTLFAAAPAAQYFKACMACDASIGCMPAEVTAWEAAYAATHRSLPLRLQLTFASAGNDAANRSFANVLTQRRYDNLVLQVQDYQGSHNGIVPQVLADGLPFSLAG